MEIVAGLAAGRSPRELRDIRGTVYRLGASEASLPSNAGETASGTAGPFSDGFDSTLLLPSYEEVQGDKRAFAAMTRLIHRETNPYNARQLVQYHGREAVVVNPPAWPLTEAEMDRLYGLPFTRRPHPSYGRQRIPAYDVVKDSIQIVRGCFGGCAFCSLSAHQGRIIQSRSRQSVVEEICRMAGERRFFRRRQRPWRADGQHVSDELRPARGAPQLPPLELPAPDRLQTARDRPRAAVELMQEARRQPGVKRVFVASGVRMDLALRSVAYIEELARHHTGGLLKVAPEHTDPETLLKMHKPPVRPSSPSSGSFARRRPRPESSNTWSPISWPAIPAATCRP